MQRHFKIAGVLLFLLGKFISCDGQIIPVLKTGIWSKFSVTTDGVYKIDYNLLKKAGINPDKVDPRDIKLYASGNGMLPQLNSAPRNGNLTELAITVSGEGDGHFDKSDYILFFGQGPDVYRFNQTANMFDYVDHLYTDKNFYFLTADGPPGKRIPSVETAGTGFPVINEFDDFVFHETNQYNELKSGREWFGEQFDGVTEQTIKFDIPGIIDNTEIKIASNVMAKSFAGSSFKLFLNGTAIGEQFIDKIPNTTYGLKGRHAIDTFKINSSSTSSATKSVQEIKFQYVKSPTGSSTGFINHFLVSFKRKLALYENQTIFSAIKSLEYATSTFEVASATSSSAIWEITDPFNAADIKFLLSESKASFSLATGSLKNFVIFNSEKLPTPDFASIVSNQDLSNVQTDLLIITHPDFKDEAQRLASHRMSFNKISARVFTTDEVYNEFSGGKQDITAIRDFAKSIYSQGGLKNILLFGRCSYDYKDRLTKNTNFVPTYESVNSLSPLETYSSDDYYAFFGDNEGEWKENPTQNHTMEVGVGRLSVKTTTEAANVVDKLIEYDLGNRSFGKWRKEILFIADDGDYSLHQSQADQLATQIETSHSEFNTQKVYLDSYTQISRPSGQISPEATEALRQALKKGVLIANYTGHGSELQWMDERILDDAFVSNWKNFASYPLLVTATCEFGRHDDPAQISTAELAQLKKSGGVIGLVTTARPVNSSSNYTLNEAFYASLFQKINGRQKDLGTIFRDTKNKSLSGVGNRNFSLLGDPSMMLAIPEQQITISNISTTDNSDTLKALSTVRVNGEIQLDGEKNQDFNGTVLATLFDKETLLQTKGDENPVFNFGLWNNALFRGEAKVVDGSFEVEFMLPKNISYQVGSGKLSIYAQDFINKTDASGSATSFKVGKSERDIVSDTTPPQIKLFLGDTTFVAGSIIGKNSELVAKLFDDSGINISSYGIGNTMVAIMDNDVTFEVAEYYVASTDDFRKGTLQFPLEDLTPGKHTITLKVWDNLNNTSSASLDFEVSDHNGIEVQRLSNYPNPFSESTTIEFVHTRPGEDLEVSLGIFDLRGQMVKTLNFSVPESQYHVSLTNWDGSDASGSKLTDGIYLMKVLVRSLADGSKNEHFAKLIISN